MNDDYGNNQLYQKKIYDCDLFEMELEFRREFLAMSFFIRGDIYLRIWQTRLTKLNWKVWLMPT